MADNRADIAIETAEAISRLFEDEAGTADETAGLRRARSIISTFVAALRIQQGPKRGRPRNPKSENNPKSEA